MWGSISTTKPESRGRTRSLAIKGKSVACVVKWCTVYGKHPERWWIHTRTTHTSTTSFLTSAFQLMTSCQYCFPNKTTGICLFILPVCVAPREWRCTVERRGHRKSLIWDEASDSRFKWPGWDRGQLKCEDQEPMESSKSG